MFFAGEQHKPPFCFLNVYINLSYYYSTTLHCSKSEFTAGSAGENSRESSAVDGIIGQTQWRYLYYTVVGIVSGVLSVVTE